MAYLNVDEIESAIDALAQNYPSLSERISLPHKTHEGRSTSALKIGAKKHEDSIDILIIGGLHAREWVPADALIALSADLLEAYTLDTGLVYGGVSFTKEDLGIIFDHVNIFISPCINPDGRYFSQTRNPVWRKNRRHSNEGKCRGVDLNRNFDFLWDHKAKFASGSKVSASDDPCHPELYTGPSPESEPETKNVVWMLDSFSRIGYFIDLHSAIPAVFYTWGSDNNQTERPEQNFQNTNYDSIRGLGSDLTYGEYIPIQDYQMLKSLATGMNDAITKVRNVSYSVEQSYSLYPTSGASDDYAYSRHFKDSSRTKVYAFTIECGAEFQPPWAEAENVIKETSAGLIAFALNVAKSCSQHKETV